MACPRFAPQGSMKDMFLSFVPWYFLTDMATERWKQERTLMRLQASLREGVELNRAIKKAGGSLDKVLPGYSQTLYRDSKAMGMLRPLLNATGNYNLQMAFVQNVQSAERFARMSGWEMGRMRDKIEPGVIKLEDAMAEIEETSGEINGLMTGIFMGNGQQNEDYMAELEAYLEQEEEGDNVPGVEFPQVPEDVQVDLEEDNDDEHGHVVPARELVH